MNDGKIDFANNLRGFAALSVVIFHLLSVFWIRADGVSGMTGNPVYTGPLPGLAELMGHLISVVNLGAFGVGLFFLISGFVIPFSLKKYSNKQFLLARFFRIYPAYLVGFLILLVVLFVGCWFYHHSYPYTSNVVIANSLLSWDLFNYPTIDGISWTLQIEIKFYLVCALFATIIRQNLYKNLLLLTFIFLIFSVLSIMFFNPVAAFLHYSKLINLVYVFQENSMFITFMFIGTAFHFYYFKAINKTQAVITIGLLLAFFATAWYVGAAKGSAGDSFFSYFLAIIIFSVCYFFKGHIKFNKMFGKLADISYSLYIVHAMSNYVLMRIFLTLGLNPYIVIFLGFGYAFAMAILLH